MTWLWVLLALIQGVTGAVVIGRLSGQLKLVRETLAAERQSHSILVAQLRASERAATLRAGEATRRESQLAMELARLRQRLSGRVTW